MEHTYSLEQRIAQVRNDPRKALGVLKSLIRGFILKSVYRITKPNVAIGRHFRAYSPLRIRGPGRVVLGNNITVSKGFLRTPCILTHTPEAEVILGDGSNLCGTRISSVSSVVVGRKALLASTTIADSLMIPTQEQAVQPEWLRQYVQAVRIGDCFWAGTNSFISGGVLLGDECVLGAGAVLVGGKEYPACSLLVGNPARKIGETR